MAIPCLATRARPTIWRGGFLYRGIRSSCAGSRPRLSGAALGIQSLSRDLLIRLLLKQNLHKPSRKSARIWKTAAWRKRFHRMHQHKVIPPRRLCRVTPSPQKLCPNMSAAQGFSPVTIACTSPFLFVLPAAPTAPLSPIPSIERESWCPIILTVLSASWRRLPLWRANAPCASKPVYIGGGTPTTLSAEQLNRLIAVIGRRFELDDIEEFTVEAGRPDTITREKLLALRRGGATRLAINPQTLDDRVLEAIGRRHTSAQVLAAFALARECGFDNINMDLIAGLPLDSLAGFERTLEGVLSLRPEGVTVHTLSMKRSASMTARPGSLPAGVAPRGDQAAGLSGEEVARMLDVASRHLFSAGYAPYYLYRQSKMLGNLENVGWSLPGREGYYNIYMMNELHTVLAAGAGAVTRLKDPRTGDIERVFNFKYPYEYIDRFDQMLGRKEAIHSFYDRHQPQ